MEKKKVLPRKQKRLAKRMILLILILVGIGVGIGTSVFAFMLYKSHQPIFVSPLASVAFVEASQQDSRAEQLKKGLQEEEIAYTAIKKGEGSSLSVTLKNNGEVLFSAKKDISVQIASLQYILSHLTMEDRQFKRLDLRYDKPIITMK